MAISSCLAKWIYVKLSTAARASAPIAPRASAPPPRVKHMDKERDPRITNLNKLHKRAFDHINAALNYDESNDGEQGWGRPGVRNGDGDSTEGIREGNSVTRVLNKPQFKLAMYL